MIPVSATQCTDGTVTSEPTGAQIAGPVLLPVLKAALALQGGS
jgi:hypothetical protein